MPYPQKCFIAGNHDACMFMESLGELPPNVHYLCNSGIEIAGLKFYGLPMFSEYVIDGSYDRLIGAIPSDTDILITHQPPYGILDSDTGDVHPHFHFGDIHIREKVMQIKPKFHLFGHNHNVSGCVRQAGILFSNAAVVDEQYRLKPRGFQLLHLHEE